MAHFFPDIFLIFFFRDKGRKASAPEPGIDIKIPEDAEPFLDAMVFNIAFPSNIRMGRILESGIEHIRNMHDLMIQKGLQKRAVQDANGLQADADRLYFSLYKQFRFFLLPEKNFFDKNKQIALPKPRKLQKNFLEHLPQPRPDKIIFVKTVKRPIPLFVPLMFLIDLLSVAMKG